MVTDIYDPFNKTGISVSDSIKGFYQFDESTDCAFTPAQCSLSALYPSTLEHISVRAGNFVYSGNVSSGDIRITNNFPESGGEVRDLYAVSYAGIAPNFLGDETLYDFDILLMHTAIPPVNQILNTFLNVQKPPNPLEFERRELFLRGHFFDGSPVDITANIDVLKVPLPSTFSLLVIGLAGIGYRRIRSMEKHQ